MKMSKLKRQAEILSKECGLPHSKALELASRLNGFKDLHQAQKEMGTGEDLSVTKLPKARDLIRHALSITMEFDLFTEVSHGTSSLIEVYPSVASGKKRLTTGDLLLGEVISTATQLVTEPDDTFTGSAEGLAAYIKAGYPKVKEVLLSDDISILGSIFAGHGLTHLEYSRILGQNVKVDGTTFEPSSYPAGDKYLKMLGWHKAEMLEELVNSISSEGEADEDLADMVIDTREGQWLSAVEEAEAEVLAKANGRKICYFGDYEYFNLYVFFGDEGEIMAKLIAKYTQKWARSTATRPRRGDQKS